MIKHGKKKKVSAATLLFSDPAKCDRTVGFFSRFRGQSFGSSPVYGNGRAGDRGKPPLQAIFLAKRRSPSVDCHPFSVKPDKPLHQGVFQCLFSPGSAPLAEKSPVLLPPICGEGQGEVALDSSSKRSKTAHFSASTCSTASRV